MVNQLFAKKHLWKYWLGIIIVLSLFPGNKLPDVEFEWVKIDNIFHLGFYSILSFLMLLGFNGGEIKMNLSKTRLYIVIIIAGIVIGISLELMQEYLIPFRFYDIKDIIINSFGTVFGSIIYNRLVKI
ncbi:VanZ family protein [Crocinitomix catalasitica]|uniref:VanZ family protein n=1 Tax=Crocinitomix catalasitica TaxID=184607 RepID=UPI0004858F1F|nr:VanZ family protein [Crocinitomix catalasitica]